MTVSTIFAIILAIISIPTLLATIGWLIVFGIQSLKEDAKERKTKKNFLEQFQNDNLSVFI